MYYKVVRQYYVFKTELKLEYYGHIDLVIFRMRPKGPFSYIMHHSFIKKFPCLQWSSGPVCIDSWDQISLVIIGA